MSILFLCIIFCFMSCCAMNVKDERQSSDSGYEADIPGSGSDCSSGVESAFFVLPSVIKKSREAKPEHLKCILAEGKAALSQM